MAGEHPTAGYILSLLGGILVIVGGISVILVVGSVGPLPYSMPDYSHFICGPIGILLGIIMMVGASYAYYNPASGPRWGSVIIIISIISWIFALGGMLAGSLIGLIGGILLIAWKPPKEKPHHKEIIIREREIVRIPCQYCNQLVDVGVKFCPFCGGSPR